MKITVICGARKITSKLCVVVTKRGEKTPIAVMLENYCRINVTTVNGSQYICVCCKKNLQTIVSQVDNLRDKWVGTENVNREQPFRVKRLLSGADVEQQIDKRTPATKARVELNFFKPTSAEKVGWNLFSSFWRNVYFKEIKSKFLGLICYGYRFGEVFL